MQNKLNILLVDDHDTIISGIKFELKEKFPNSEITVAETTKDAMNIVRIADFDIAIIDISFRNEKNSDGVELCKKIKILKPKIKLISYTSYASRTHYINELQKIKVEAVVSKNDGNFALKHAINEILSNNIPFYSREVLDSILKNKERKSKNNFGFTKREKEVLQLIHRYLTYPQIAKKLSVSINTVTTHAKNLHAKCKVKKKHELIEKTTDFIDLI